MTARTWLTLPTYNEVANIERIVRAVVAQLERAIPGDFQVLVVDDSSPDGTGEVADRLAEEIPEVCVLHRKEKDGLGRAYLAGFQYAVDQGAELVGVMDADFSHDPAYLPTLLEAANHYDLVIGSRYVDGGQIADWPPLRRLLSKGGSLYARSILGVHVRAGSSAPLPDDVVARAREVCVPPPEHAGRRIGPIPPLRSET